MADWFISSAGAGTKDAMSAANAGDTTMLLAVCGSAGWGDRVWVARDVYTDIQSFFCGRSGPTFNTFSNAMQEVIGWPSAGDYGYEERPAGAISAGWDAHVSAFPDFPYPTITNSDASGMSTAGEVRNGTHFTNFTMVASRTGTVALNWSGLMGGGDQMRVGKMCFLNVRPNAYINPSIDEVFWCGSLASAEPLPNFCKKITVAQSSVVGGALFAGGGIHVNELRILSSSVSLLMASAAVQRLGRIGRIYGSFMVASALLAPETVTAGEIEIFVDDYYSLGPRRIASSTKSQVSRGVSATHSGIAATLYNTSSYSTSALGQFQDGPSCTGYAGQWVAVNSGTPFVVRWHFMTVNPGSIEMWRDAFMHLNCAGGRFARITLANSGIRAGTPALWSGNSTTAGSAWLGYASFLPTETGTAFLCARAPSAPTWRSGSSFGFVSPFFEIGSA